VKRFVAYILILIGGILLMAPARQELFPTVKNESFGAGEIIDYKVNFAFFTVGKAQTIIHPQVQTYLDRSCYKVDVFGRTTGMVDWLAKVDDQWGAYIDTASLLPLLSYRRIREGKYRKDEQVTFLHETMKAETRVLDKQTGQFKPPQVYETPRHVRDLIAGFMFMRTVDFSKMKEGEKFVISGFFEDTVYYLTVRYAGKEVVSTAVGRIPCLVLKPFMPNNSLFDGEDSITAWVSDDANHVPVKVSAEMFIGSTGIEMISFRGLKNQIRILP
jgi:hypothetical protein